MKYPLVVTVENSRNLEKELTKVFRTHHVLDWRMSEVIDKYNAHHYTLVFLLEQPPLLEEDTK